MIAIGYRGPQEDITSSSSVPVAEVSSVDNTKPAVNDVVATDIAAHAAQTAALAIAPNISERAISTKIQAAYASADNASVGKPTVVAITDSKRDIQKYTVLEGDTVETLAAKFSISTDTIKWANNLTGNTLAVGSEVEILPRDGIIYTVKAEDTIDKIADKYKTDATLVTSYNDLELNGLSAGLRLIIPGGVLPETERPGYTAPVRISSGYNIAGYGAGFGGKTWHIKVGTPMYAGNTYAFGNCTAYAFDRRAEMGRPVGPRWGNASTWASMARSAGYTVNRTPAVGAVMQNGGGYGHVAIVERVHANGDVEISEMNASVAGGGFNKVSGRMVSAATAGQYMYIH